MVSVVIIRYSFLICSVVLLKIVLIIVVIRFDSSSEILNGMFVWVRWIEV